MVPKFSSQTDMMGFIRALPTNANYAKMLKDDFGIADVPADAPEYQKEYLWKYLVQGTYMGKSEADLLKYAVQGVEKLAKELPHIKTKYDTPVVVSTGFNTIEKSTGKRGRKRRFEIQSDGVVALAQHVGLYCGWFGGKVVVKCATEAKAIAKMKAKGFVK